jgi:hypothetical protein
VASVDVDFEAKTALITMEPGRELSKSQCEKAFGESRYKVLGFEAKSGGSSPGT